ncbi:hypothetical protein GW17_00011491 [Ensete ventricosum]|nr:hypothetical protein GW17_00011491 [Ensete ventricosum]
MPARGANCWTLGRGCRPWLALLPVGAMALAAGVAVPWQGGCRWATTATAVQRGQEGYDILLRKG